MKNGYRIIPNIKKGVADMDYLKELGISDEDIAVILEHNRRYGDAIANLAKEYMLTRVGKPFMKPYEEGERDTSTQERDAFLLRAKQADPDAADDYMTSLLFWLHCVPYAKEVYDRL